MDSKDEDDLLRSVALQTARSILLERQRIERELAAERERMTITLGSIGDGVISTDAAGRVVFLNAVAEVLTGWRQADAAGQPLADVFRIVNEMTRLPVENPALRALAEGRVVGLANHTILIARDGSERPIDDSAAPMRDEAGAIIGVVLVFRDVSAMKRADQTQTLLASIVQSSEDAILSKTLDGVIRSWNTAAERLFGYTAEEAVGQSITILIPTGRLEEEAYILDRLRRGERVEHFETVRRTKNGRHIDISLTVSPLKDHEGRVIGASKIARDITDRRRADAILRASDARHRFLARLAAATQSLSDPAEVMTTNARLLAEHLDADRCAYVEADGESFVIGGDYARDVASIIGRWPIGAFGAELERSVLANEPLVVSDVDANGEVPGLYRSMSIQALICVPLHKGGKLAAAMMVHQREPRHWTPDDLRLVETVVGRSWESIERTRAVRALEDVAEHLSLALDAAGLGDWSWDIASDAVTLSARAAEILGLAPGEALTWSGLNLLIHAEDRTSAQAALERAIVARDNYDAEYRVLVRGGRESWISARGRAQYRADGTPSGMFGVVQDVTEKKHLEHELRRRAFELAEADRKKDDFIALLAHELRNPLAPIRTGLQVMRLAPGNAEAVAKARATMDRQLSHMVRLIDDLLDISRMNRNKLHLQKSRVLLSEVVSHAIEAVGPAIDTAGHELHVALPPEPVTLDADLVRLAQVFGNLLANSAKYTEAGGHIWLRAELSERREQASDLPGKGREVIVSVSDTGIGIPAEALPHIFEMFSQVDRSMERATGGLGIGLALVKGLVETHGGSVSAESAGPNAGSTFTVRLPIAEARASSPAPEPVSAPAPRAPKRVLVADDNRDALSSMAELLALLGNEVHIAHDGLEAVSIAEQVRPDLVLMDVGMPRLNGLDAARQIREQPWSHGVTIIALTGWGQEDDRERSRAAGCDGHMVKPIGLPQLEKVLASLPRDAGR